MVCGVASTRCPTEKNTLAVWRRQGYSLLRKNKAYRYLIDLQYIETMHLVFCNVATLAEIRTLCGRELDNRLDLIGIMYILRAYVGIKSRTKSAIPISKERSLLSSLIAVGLQVCFGDICNCNNLEKRGAKPLHFRCLFSTFVENIQNYGSVTLFSCDERRKFQAQ